MTDGIPYPRVGWHEPADGEQIDCPDCDGIGLDDDGEDCPTCDGEGELIA